MYDVVALPTYFLGTLFFSPQEWEGRVGGETLGTSFVVWILPSFELAFFFVQDLLRNTTYNFNLDTAMITISCIPAQRF